MRIILVDNEALQISNLQKLTERIYPNTAVHIATKFDKAFEIVKKHPKDSIFFCSKDLPGLNGMKLIEKLQKEKMVDNYYFVLTYNNLTQDQKRNGVKSGVDRFLQKPYQIEDLLPILKNGHDLINARIARQTAFEQYKDLKDKFDEEVLKIKEIIDFILEERIPGITEKSQKIEKAALWIAKKYGVRDELELNDLKISSKLQFTGRLVLGDNFINEPVMKEGRLTDPVMKGIPGFAVEIVSRIKGYDNIKTIIENLYENFDGTGFPEGRIGSEIPKLTRVLRVCTDFYDQVDSGIKIDEAVEDIVNEARRLYDYVPVAYIDQYLAANNEGTSSNKSEIAISIKELTEGMTLSRNIVSKEGLILLGKSTTINEENLNKLRNSASTDGIIGDIYIFDIANKEERKSIE